LGEYLLVGVPLRTAGLYAGHHVQLNLRQRQMAIVIALPLIASGLSRLWRVGAPDGWPARVGPGCFV
jgi:hypothetical protein